MAYGISKVNAVNTKNVDINGSGSTSTDVDSLNDVGGTVSSCGIGNGKLRVIRLSVNDNAIVCPQDQVSLCPFHTGVRFALNISRKLYLGSCSCSQTSQQLDIKLDLWRFCWGSVITMSEKITKKGFF